MKLMMRQLLMTATAGLVGLACGCNSKSPHQADSKGASALKATDIGFVLEVKGDWRLKGRDDTPIAAGDSLPAEGILTRLAGSDRESEVVVSLCTGKVMTYRETPSQLDSRVDPAHVNRFWSLANKRYHGDLVSAQSRGGHDQNKLRDSVVRLQDGELHLAAVFEEMPPGIYRLRLEPIQDLTAENAAPVIPLDVYEWSPSTPSTLKVESSPHGAYELYAVEVDTANSEAAALVVICAPREFDKIANELQAARELVSSWEEVTSPAVNRRFLQATLASLAAEIMLSHPSK
jgi:hypothetical protein